MQWPSLWQASWRRRVVGLAAVSFCIAGLTLALALLMSNVSQVVTLLGGSALVLVLLIRWFLVILLRSQGEKLGQLYIAQVRSAFFERWLYVPTDKAPARFGVMLMRLISDANALKQWVALGWLQMLTGALTIAAILLVCALNWPRLFSAFQIVIVVFFSWHLVLTHWILKSERDIRRARGRLSGQVGEFTMARLAAIQMRWLPRVTRRLNNASAELGNKSAAQQWPIMLVNGLTDVAVPILIVVLSIQFAGDAPSLAAAMLIIGLLASTLIDISRAWVFACQFYVARQRLTQVATNMAVANPTGKLNTTAPCSLALRSLKLDGLGAWKEEAEYGERVWVFGLGKSQLGKALFRQVEPVQGYVMLGGRKLGKLSHRVLFNTVAVESADIPIVRGSIRRNLSSSPVDDAMLANIMDLVGLAAMSLDDKVAELGKGLSNVEQWQIRIARALSKQPRVLYLDDPPIRLAPVLHRLAHSFSGTLIVASDYEFALDFDQHWQLDPVRLL